MFACLPLVHIFQMCLNHFPWCCIKSAHITWKLYSMCFPVMMQQFNPIIKQITTPRAFKWLSPLHHYIFLSCLPPFFRNCSTSITWSLVSTPLTTAPSCKYSKSVMLSFTSVSFLSACISESPTVLGCCCTRWGAESPSVDPTSAIQRVHNETKP